MRIPMPDNVAPNSFRGDRLSNMSPNMAAPARELEGLGKAISGLGKAFSTQKRVSAFKDRQAVETWSKQQAAQYNDDLANSSPDGSDFLSRREENLIKSFSGLQKEIADPAIKAEAGELFETMRVTHFARGAEDIVRKAEGYAVTTTQQSVSEAIEAGQISNLDQFNDYYENVALPKLASVIDDKMRFEMAGGEIARSMREAYIQMDPSVAIHADKTPEGGIWSGMDDAEWSSLANKAVKIDAERIQAAAAAKSEADNKTVKAGYDLALSGGLNSEWLEGNRQSMSPATYRAFNSAIARGDGKTSDDSLIPVYNAALMDEDQSSVQDEAFTAYSNGTLSKTDFGRVMTRSRETERMLTEKPWAVSIRKDMATRLAPANDEDKELHAKRLQGVDAFDEWLAANPAAKPDDAHKKAKEISGDVISATLAERRKSLAIPRYASGPRQSLTLESAGMAAQRLSQAYKSGAINAEELNREAALLRRWMNLFDEEASSGPA